MTSAVLALLVGCAREDPCPRGTQRSVGRCLSPESTDGEAVETSDGSVPDAGPDAEETGEPPMDASVIEPDPMDAGADEDEPVPERDADSEDDAESDANPEEDAESAVPPPECPAEAHAAWRRFQMSEDAVPAILACYQADPACATGACDASGCLRRAAQVDGCDRCAAAEVACSAKRCAVPCSISTDDDACRACACSNGCLEAPEGCGYGSFDVCADCAGASCGARLASLTDTITVPIFFHLLHDSSDPVTGLPAYAVGEAQHETILDIDARLEQLNGMLESARPDARRLRVIRAGVDYVPAPGAGVCPDPVGWSDAHRFYGGLNVVLTSASASCPATTSSAYAARASGATLLRNVGNMLGIAPAEQKGEPWGITPEQLASMHNYARWRLGASEAVPHAERQESTSFLHGPAAPIWDKLTNRDWALTNASVFERTSLGPFSPPVVESFVVPPTRASRRVLGVRLSARYTGIPSENLRVIINSQRNTSTPISRRDLWLGDGMLVVEEAFDTSSRLPWFMLRNRYAAGTWRVSIDDTAKVTFHDVRLELVLGDRSFSKYDRHARGVPDVMVYRPSTSQLFTASNPANRQTDFGAVVSDRVPPLPNAQAKVTSGDVDGDGHVDLLARRDSTIWIAFNKRGFAAWREGSIAGTDRPSGTDDVLVGDFDGDGFGDLMRRRPDLARKESLWAYHRGFGDGTFEAARTPSIGGDPYPAEAVWTVMDVGRAGRTGLVVRQNQQAYLVINHNDTHRSTTSGAMPILYAGFAPIIGSGYEAFFAGEQLVALDANQDGSEDLVVRRPGSGEWFVCLNDGNERFSAMRPLTIGGSPSAFTDTDIILGTTP